MWRAVAMECKPGRRDRLDRADGIPLDARNLHEPTHRIAGEPEMVFHADLCGVLHLLRRATEDLGQRARCHRACCSDLALAADFRAGDRRRLLVDRAERSGNQQEV